MTEPTPHPNRNHPNTRAMRSGFRHQVDVAWPSSTPRQALKDALSRYGPGATWLDFVDRRTFGFMDAAAASSMAAETGGTYRHYEGEGEADV